MKIAYFHNNDLAGSQARDLSVELVLDAVALRMVGAYRGIFVLVNPFSRAGVDFGAAMNALAIFTAVPGVQKHTGRYLD